MENLTEIYEKYAGYVYRFLMSKSASPDISEEITQETFYQAVKSIDKFDYSCSITTWLCGIAKNKYQEYLRKNPTHDDVSQIKTESTFSSAESEYIKADEKIGLLRKIHCLPDPYKEVIYLRIYGNLSYKEIGQIHGKSENWSRVVFYRGKEMLKKEIENEE